MNRRSFLAATAAFAALSATAARADEDYVKDIVDWLEQHGYSDITVSRTLLGRVRIVATKDGVRRELVCNPRTGEILRDVSIAASGEVQPPASSPGGKDDDDEGDDDHSGHGGGGDDDNSGHGSSGSNNDDHSGHSGGDSGKSGHGGGGD